MNRRDFNKLGALSLVSLPLALPTKTDNRFRDCPDFLNIFQKIDCTKNPKNSKGVDFPINYYGYDGSYQPDFVRVFPYKIKGRSVDEVNEQLYQDAANTLLAAATDRNVVVYNKAAQPGKITPRLLGLITLFIRTNLNYNNISPITDIFCQKSIYRIQAQNINELNKWFPKTKWHPIPDKTWNYLQNYYHTELGGTLPKGYENMLLAVTKDKDKKKDEPETFVHPIISNLTYNVGAGKQERYSIQSGLAILDNRKVLLGAF